jgi:tetratricopeptide (TPR) repeat protein
MAQLPPQALGSKDERTMLQGTQQARELHLSGQPEAALARLDQVHQPSGNTIRQDWMYTRGRVLEALRRRAAAEEAYREASDPIHPEGTTRRLAREGLTRVALPPAATRAQALEKAGDFLAAVRSYEEAVRLWPGDAPLWSDLSWAAVQAKDGATARAAAEKALALATYDTLKAAALYNLGRAHELLGQREAAIACYHSAVALRAPLKEGTRQYGDEVNPSLRAVAEALRRLGAPPFPTTGRALRGPFHDDGQAGLDEGTCHVTSQPESLPPPFVDVRACTGANGYHLRVATTGGVFVLDNYSPRENRAEHSLPSVRGQAGRLLIQAKRFTGRFDGNEDTGLIVCAAAAGGVSCVGPVEFRRTYIGYKGGKEDGHAEKPRTLFGYLPRLLPGDVLVLDPTIKRAALDLTGRFKLTFAPPAPPHPAPPK